MSNKIIYNGEEYAGSVVNDAGVGEFTTNEGKKVPIGNNAEIFNSYGGGTTTSYRNIATGDYSHAEGFQNIASGHYSHVEGAYSVASGNYAHSEGEYTTASEEFAHAEGCYTNASGSSAHAEGQSTVASGLGAHAEGDHTQATDSRTHAEGDSTQATEYAAHAEGQGSIASGTASHAEGYHSEASEYYAHAEGQETIASGTGSHAEGINTQAIQGAAHAEGNQTISSGIGSHAEGSETTASGACSHAEGYNTIASGSHSHASGEGTDTNGYNDSVALGLYTKTGSSQQVVIGKYNIIDSNSAFVVGNGSAPTSRSYYMYNDVEIPMWTTTSYVVGDIIVCYGWGNNYGDCALECINNCTVTARRDILNDIAIASGATQGTNWKLLETNLEKHSEIIEHKANIATLTWDGYLNVSGGFSVNGIAVQPGENGDIANPNISDAYSSSATYNAGDYCIYQDTLYKCNTAITVAESFDSSKWTQTTIGAELLTIINRVSTIETALNGYSFSDVMTQAQYDALDPNYDSNTIYPIVG